MLNFLFEDVLVLNSAVALFVSFLISIIFGNKFINFIKLKFSNNQPIQVELPENQQKKTGTPTFGGILIIASTLISTLLFADLTNPTLWAILFCGLSFATIGLIDDYKKVMRKLLPNYNAQYGLSARTRLIAEFIIAGITIFIISYFSYDSTIINIPFFDSLSFDAGIFYYLFASIVLVGTANAVNITDGLDGLATKTSIVSLITFTIIMSTLYIPNASELFVFCGALGGALLGFLWFNTKPASIFMGDVGSLFIGSIFGTLAIILKAEFLFAIFGFIYVAELGSSFFQTMYFKYTRKKFGEGKRLFKMAPLHHHFEMMNIPETKVVDRFFITSIILAIIALSSLLIG